MARRVIEGQIGMFDAGEEMSQGTCPRDSSVSADALPPDARKLAMAYGPSEGKAFGGRETPARVLTLAEIENLEPFRAVVWIETRPWATRRETEENAAYRFLLLFEAVFQTIGIPIGSERKHYHFKYTYTNGRNYYHWRIDEFYGQEWRVWDKCPTEAQREDTRWLNM